MTRPGCPVSLHTLEVRGAVVRLLIAVAIGVLLGAAVGFTLPAALAGTANGTASHASLYQYGSR